MNEDKIDLTSVFEDTKPIPDFKIPRIEVIMNVDEAGDDPPRKIIFNLPGDVQEKYVRMDSLPVEVRNLIHEFLMYDGSWFINNNILKLTEEIGEFSRGELKKLEEITELDGFVVGDEIIIWDGRGFFLKKELKLNGTRAKVVGFKEGNRLRVISSLLMEEIDILPECARKLP